jgi:hypothetical protein
MLVALGLSLVGGLSTSLGALFVVLSETPNMKMLGLLQVTMLRLVFQYWSISGTTGFP